MPGQSPAAPLGELLSSLRMLSDHIRAVDVEHPPDGWMARDALLEPARGPLASLLDLIGQRYIESRGQAAAVSFMLRFSWSAGPMVAAWLGLGRHLRYRGYALRFASTTALEAVCIRDSALSDAGADVQASRRRPLDDLIAHTEPVLEAQHRYSRMSRHALWSMATSVWAAQFVEVAERLGDAERGRREAVALFELLPRIRRAAPQLYAVASGERRGVCHVRGACCFNHNSSGGQHCMICPLIADDERARRNRIRLDNRPRMRTLEAALAASLREGSAR